MRAQRRLLPRAGGADVACELGARVDGVRRQRVGVFVSAGEAVGGPGRVGVSVLILSTSTASGGFVALFALFLAFFHLFSPKGGPRNTTVHESHTARANTALKKSIK